jgi:uncharacterized membrane protein SpoIIM required for sporulation
VDIDQFIATNTPAWNRLGDLAKRARHRTASLTADEVDELVALYQKASADLSVARTRYGAGDLTVGLSRTLGQARGVIYRRRANPARSMRRFLTETYPAAVYHARRSVAVAAAAMFIPALVVGVWLSVNGEARNATIDEQTQALLAQSQFEDYYSSQPAESWAFDLFVHNIIVSIQAFAAGALLGVLGIYILGYNGLNLGVAGAVMHAYGKGALFWGLITPHGLIELTSVCLAGGAGLAIGWSIIDPGDRRRADAIAESGLRAVTIVMGTMLLFIAAGFIEAFVTPSGLPTAARVAIGVLVWATAMVWVFGVGRSAAARGATGRFGEELELETADLVARGVPATSP